MSQVGGQVLRHVVDAITPASEANAAAARERVRDAGSPMLERLAAAIAGAQHAPAPHVERRTVLVVAGDHGCGDPGISLGADHPTILAAHEIAAGRAALCAMARGTPIVLVDAGVRERAHMPPIAIPLGRGPTHDLLREPAQTVVDAALSLEAGIALALSLYEPAPGEKGPSLFAVGALGVGAEVASAALLGATAGATLPLPERDDGAELAMTRGASMHGASGLELLAHFGGPETGVLAGVMLAAASMNVPVILDSYGTGAAALVARAFAPAVTGYLVAAHRGSFTMPAIIGELGLTPVFEVGVGHGEGTGAAMVLGLLDQVAALASRR